MDKRLNITLIPKILFYWYITIFVSTEILSLLNLINSPLIILTNSIFFMSILLIFRQEFSNLLRQAFVIKSVSLYITILILILTFVQGFLSAPNTTDGMVRRLPIVMFWVQEQTLYQDIIRNGHDFMGPFAQYILLHLYIIFNGDRILFLSQWIAFIGVITLSLLISQKIGASSKSLPIILMLVVTLPIAVLGSNSIQTDMVTTVFVLFSVYFALNFLRNTTFINCVLVSIAIGLGILTKATFFLYLVLPLGLLLPVVFKLNKKLLIFGLISAFIIGVIQARFSEQSLRLYGELNGSGVIQGKSGYTNEIINPQVTFSNLLRNLILHLPFPVGKEEVEKWVSSIHAKMGLIMDDPRTNYYGTKFSVNPVIFPQEDRAGNPVHLSLILLAGVVIIFWHKKIKNNRQAVYLYALSIISLIIFSAILKWQPFHTRLLMPFFIVGSITSTLILSNFDKLKIFLNLLLVISVLLSLLLILFNVSKPFISYGLFYSYVKDLAPPLSSVPESVFTKDREENIFNARYYWYKPYKDVMEKTKEYQFPGTISFNLMDEFEYPMWYFLRKNNQSLRVVPYPKKTDETIIITTSKNPYNLEGYKTGCIKTEIDYGYACISKKLQSI